jgi:SAM-dependent methyltransferase
MTFKEFPIENDSVDLYYSEHVLEHLPDINCEHVLREIYRTLKPGGAARIVVPDIDIAYQACKGADKSFFESMSDYYKKYQTVEECFVHIFAGYLVRGDHGLDVLLDPARIRHDFHSMDKHDFLERYSQRIWKWLTPKIQHKFGGYHINWFDTDKLSNMLKDVGFQEVYKSSSQKSRLREMRGAQFDKRPTWSLHIEAKK